MTTRAVPLIATKYAEDSQTPQYTAPSNTRTVIDKMTASNNTGSPATFAVNLVASGGSAGASNLIYTKTIAANTTEELTELTGHVLAAGGFISTIAGTASAIVIRASGREISG